MSHNVQLPCLSTNLSIGIEEIDEQHQIMLRLINDIQRAIDSQKGTAIIDDLLRQLFYYTRIHFLVEESLMRNIQYPEFEKHRAAHQALLDECMNIRSQIQAGQMTHQQLMEYLAFWFNNHIRHADKDYSEHLQKSGAKKVLKRMQWMSNLWQWRRNP